MKGSGNSLATILQKVFFALIPTSGGRSRYISKHAYLFKHIGKGVFWQPRNFPTDPELISLGDNVMIASNVTFVNHDIISAMLNRKYKTIEFESYEGCIEVGDNVMIGTGTIILPNVKIGSNVIIGAGSIVSKDIPSNTIAAGTPCHKIGEFSSLVEKYKNVHKVSPQELWQIFEKNHKRC